MTIRDCIARSLPRAPFRAAVVLGLFGLFPAHGAIVDLSFSGTCDTRGGALFGLSGSAVPYSYEITYETALNSNPFFFAAGASLEGYVTTHEWHGYSASGIIASRLTFGTKSWTAADLAARDPAVGVSADLWFDTDLSVSAPTLCWMFLSQAGSLQIGAGGSSNGQIFMSPVSIVSEPGKPLMGVSSDLSIQVVPEPGSVTLLALGGLGIWLRRGAPQSRRGKVSHHT
jgi:hypothetical protein